MKLVYVAGPFRGKNHWEVECNIRRAEELALNLWRTNIAAVFCPHTNTRFFDGAAHDSVWLEGDLAWLRKADAVVLTPDWRRSSGARAEVLEALRLGIPVFPTVFDFKAWAENNADFQFRQIRCDDVFPEHV